MNGVRAPRNPFVAPAWIALASLVGLISALVGDGVFDLVSWLVFAALIALSVRAWLRRDRGGR
jgi:xanthosine utilization system XapX-like protein